MCIPMYHNFQNLEQTIDWNLWNITKKVQFLEYLSSGMLHRVAVTSNRNIVASSFQ
jgi:hypothetical protein